MRSYFNWILSVAALIVMLSGCGGSTPPPPPPLALPAPAPVNPTGQVGYPGYVGASSCGGSAVSAPGGQGPQTFSARLNGSPGSYIQLTIAPQQYGTFYSQSSQVQGSVAVFLSDQQPPSLPGQPQQPVAPICGQTQPNASQVNIYSSYDSSIAMVLYGTAQLPAYTQYSSYPTGQLSPTNVTVYVGYGCSAQLDIQNQKFVGCVGIQYGGQGQVRWYTSY